MDGHALQDVISKYGLHVVEIDSATGEVEWLACKFCPLFGAEGRNEKYIMAFGSPFHTFEMQDHLLNRHRAKWVKFRKADDEQRKAFFNAKPLPEQAVFDRRIAELKRSWGFTRSERAANGEKKYARLVQRSGGMTRQTAEPAVKKTSRKRTRSDIALFPKGETKQLVEAPTLASMIDDLFLFPEHAAAARQITDLVINGDLRDHHPRNISSLGHFCVPRRYDPPHMLPVFRTRGLDEDGYDQTLSPVVLLYLLRGIPLSVIHMLLKDMHELVLRCAINRRKQISQESLSEHDDASRHDRGRKCKRPGRAERAQLDEDQKHDADESSTGEDLHSESEKNEFVSSNADYWVDRLQDVNRELEDMVWNIGNSVCAEGLRILREFTDQYIHNWAILLSTRPCPEMGDGAIELLVLIWDRPSAPHWIHVVSVRPVDRFAGVVDRIMDCVCENWRARWIGIKSGLSGADSKEKECELSLFEALRKLDGVNPDVKHVSFFDNPERKDIVPYCLPGITGTQLAKIIKSYRMASSWRPTGGEAASEQESEGTAMRIHDQELEKKAVLLQIQELENIAGALTEASTSPEDALVEIIAAAPEAVDILRGLSRAWSTDVPCDGRTVAGCTRTGLVVHSKSKLAEPTAIDAEAERIFWARSLVRLHAVQHRPVDCSVGPPDYVYEEAASKLWSGNWSNRPNMIEYSKERWLRVKGKKQ